MWYLQFFAYFITSLFCIGCFCFSWTTLRDNQRRRQWARSRQKAQDVIEYGDCPVVSLSHWDRLTAPSEAEVAIMEARFLLRQKLDQRIAEESAAQKRLLAEIAEITA